jgi:exosortase
MKNKYYRLSILIIIAVLSGLLIYKTAIIQVISAVIHRQGSSHGIFIPFLSLYFLWLKRDDLKKIEPKYNYFGIIFVLIGLFPPLSKTGTFHLQFIGFIIFLAGLLSVLFGKEFFKNIMFPLFFLITMCPIPENLYESMTNFIRHISTGGSLKIISLFGISYFKEGWMVQLPNALLKVNMGCSGIRYLVSYFVFGIAYAWLYRDTLKDGLILVALTIPISLFASICRLTAIFVLTYTISPRMAEHWPHVFISWTVFFVILIACITTDQYFQKRQFCKNLAKQY